MIVYQIIAFLSLIFASMFLKSNANSRKELRRFLESESITFINLIISSSYKALYASLNLRVLRDFFFLTTRRSISFNVLNTFSCDKLILIDD